MTSLELSGELIVPEVVIKIEPEHTLPENADNLGLGSVPSGSDLERFVAAAAELENSIRGGGNHEESRELNNFLRHEESILGLALDDRDEVDEMDEGASEDPLADEYDENFDGQNTKKVAPIIIRIPKLTPSPVRKSKKRKVRRKTVKATKTDVIPVQKNKRADLLNCENCPNKFRTHSELQRHAKVHVAKTELENVTNNLRGSSRSRSSRRLESKPVSQTNQRKPNKESVEVTPSAPSSSSMTSYPCKFCSSKFTSKLGLEIHECPGEIVTPKNANPRTGGIESVPKAKMSVQKKRKAPETPNKIQKKMESTSATSLHSLQVKRIKIEPLVPSPPVSDCEDAGFPDYGDYGHSDYSDPEPDSQREIGETKLQGKLDVKKSCLEIASAKTKENETSRTRRNTRRTSLADKSTPKILDEVTANDVGLLHEESENRTQSIVDNQTIKTEGITSHLLSDHEQDPNFSEGGQTESTDGDDDDWDEEEFSKKGKRKKSIGKVNKDESEVTASKKLKVKVKRTRSTKESKPRKLKTSYKRADSKLKKTGKGRRPRRAPLHSSFCTHCDFIIKKTKYREPHMREHHPEVNPEFQCDLCPEKFYSENSRFIHRRYHSMEHKFKCAYCEVKCFSRSKLHLHEKKHSNVQPSYLCQFCSSPFQTVLQVERHEKVTCSSSSTYKKPKLPQGKSVKCPECDATLSSKTSLDYHMAAFHAPKEGFICTECGAPFASEQTLKAHERRHLKKFECTVPGCDHAFAYNAELLSHLNTHAGIKPFKCTHCDIYFGRTRDRNIHIKRVHADEEAKLDESKPHKCSYCGKGFNIKYALRIHEQYHRGEKPYSCKICGEGFRANRGLRSHNLRMHTEGVLTKIEKRKLNVPLLRDTPCDFCDKKFVSREMLRAHVRRMHAKDFPYYCQNCGKGFLSKYFLEVHERIHRGEKPYHCKFCKSDFRSKELIIVHHKKHHPNFEMQYK